MNKRMELWLKFLYFIGRQRKAINYIRYHGLSLHPMRILHIKDLRWKRLTTGLSSASLLALATYLGIKRFRRAHRKTEDMVRG